MFKSHRRAAGAGEERICLRTNGAKLLRVGEIPCVVALLSYILQLLNSLRGWGGLIRIRQPSAHGIGAGRL